MLFYISDKYICLLRSSVGNNGMGRPIPFCATWDVNL